MGNSAKNRKQPSGERLIINPAVLTTRIRPVFHVNKSVFFVESNMIRGQIYFFVSLSPGFITSMADDLLTVAVSTVLRHCKYKTKPGKKPDVIDTVLMCQGNKGNQLTPIAQKE